MSFVGFLVVGGIGFLDAGRLDSSNSVGSTEASVATGWAISSTGATATCLTAATVGSFITGGSTLDEMVSSSVNLVALDILLFLCDRVGVVTAIPAVWDGSSSMWEIGPATSSGRGMRVGLEVFGARGGLRETESWAAPDPAAARGVVLDDDPPCDKGVL